jgi:hypothetical protein
LHTAVYDAVNALIGNHQPYRVQFRAAEGSSAEAAAVAAGNEILNALYPSLSARSHAEYEGRLRSLPATEAVAQGLAFGRLVAEQGLEWRAADGSTTTVPYIPSDEPGEWRRTPPFFRPPLDPQWGYVETFALPAIEPFVPPGPPPLSSVAYADAWNEVQDLGAQDSLSRTAAQKESAVFWSDFSYTATPPGHWCQIAAGIARDKELGLAENARLFALLSIALADAAVVSWEAKFRYNFWRPVTAIQQADRDGNPATQGDTAWAALLPAPSFPEYTSGHSTFSKASAHVLTRFFGTDTLRFTARSDSLPGIARTYTSLSACADEIGLSRIYGGIHFQFSNRDGKQCGLEIAEHVVANYLLPNHRLPLLTAARLKSGTTAFRVHGVLGRDCVVEASADLRGWHPISTNAAVPGGVVVVDPDPDRGGARFYRVRQP